jgi:adenylate cyclase
MGVRTTERRLAAIFIADVVGYSRLMSEREEATLLNLHACLQIFYPGIANHGGRVFGAAGDSVIAEFPSTVEAVRAAVEIQQALAQRNAGVTTEDCMQFRIGISVGDVMVDGDNLMGDGVNIAARLESLAEPGGINISGHVYHQVRNKVQAGFEDAGRQALKNIPTPVQVYRVVADPSVVPAPPKHTTPAGGLATPRRMLAAGIASLAVIAAIWVVSQRQPTAPPEEPVAATLPASQQASVPSIAVLPFANMSGDAQQEYFIDGITEDIIIDLSRLSNLMVIAWSTTSGYKGRTVPPPQVGKDLGVAYVLEGSVRKSGDRLRITAQLVDTASSNPVWAERYDRKLTEVFQLQDDVTQKIVTALAINLTETETGQLGKTKTTNNVAAYDALLKGLGYFRLRTPEGYALAQEAYEKAIEYDPGYARAYGAMAVVLSHLSRRGWSELTHAEAQARSLELAQKAVSLDLTSPQVYWALGYAHLFRKEYDHAAAAAKRSVELAPNYADGYGLLAFINNWQGKGEDALRYIQKAAALNPHYTFDYPWNRGLAYYNMGRYAEAVDGFREAATRNPNVYLVRLFLTSSYVRLGNMEDAEWEVEQILTQNPDSKLSQVAHLALYESQDRLKALLDDLRKAGLPE